MAIIRQKKSVFYVPRQILDDMRNLDEVELKVLLHVHASDEEEKLEESYLSKKIGYNLNEIQRAIWNLLEKEMIARG